MSVFTKDRIREIAEQLDCGFRAFIHRTTGEFIFIPDTNNSFDMNMDVWNTEIEVLENNFSDYKEIEKWDSSEAFDLMVDFTEQLTNNPHLQKQLTVALNKKKPFREFKL